MVRVGRRKKAEDNVEESAVKTKLLSANGPEENVVVVQRTGNKKRPAPWRLSVDLPRALLDTLLAFVGYLLEVYPLRCYFADCLLDFRMLAVMTLNVGYFLSVLSGIYLGSMIAGRYSILGDASGSGIAH
jgi:hypothetical protein